MIKLEASEKIRRALRAQTRTHSNMKYLSGEEVFYKRDDQKKWQGPGRVIGQDGSKVLIKIPTGLITVHSCRVILTSDAEQQRLGIKEIQIDNGTENDNFTSDEEEVEVDPTKLTEGNFENIIVQRMLTRSRAQENLEDDKVEETNDEYDHLMHVDEEELEEAENQNNEQVEIEQDLGNMQEQDNGQVVTDEIAQENEVKKSDDLVNTKDLPMKDQIIRYKDKQSDEWKHCKILGRGGKATGPYRYFLNIKCLDGDVENV